MSAIAADPVAAFRAAMLERGISPPAEIVPDGRLHRFHVEGDRRGTRNGWYILHPDDPPAGGFGSWRTGIEATWCARERAGLSAAELDRWRRRMDAARRQREEEERQRRARARDKARRLWKEARPADPAHGYLTGKGVAPHGLRQLGDTLLVPVHGSDGALLGLQRIFPDGAKRFVAGTDVSGGYFPVGRPDGTVVVAEGFATAATIHEATGHAVAVAFNCGNLRPVAEALRAKLGADTRLIVAADDDRETPHNSGLAHAAAAARAVDGLLAVPGFEKDEAGSDFNDVCALRGPLAVLATIEAAAPPSPEALALLQAWTAAARRNGGKDAAERPPATGGADEVELRPYSAIRPERVEWLWEPRVVRAVPTLLVGPPGLGKTLLAVWLAARASRGQLGAPPMDVIYATAEDSPEHTLAPRLMAAGADRSRVHDVRLRRDGLAAGLTLPDDIDALARAVERVGAGLLIVDPLMAHLAGGIDSHRDHSIRLALAPVYRLAEESGCTPLVIGHLNKAPGSDLFGRVGGSIGLTAAARSILLMTTDPEAADDQAARVLTHGKSNLGPLSPALRLRVVGSTVQGEDGPIPTACIEVGGEAGHLRLADALTTPDGEERTARDEAREFLLSELAAGPVQARELQRRARDAGLNWNGAVRRAAEKLRVQKRKAGFGQGWEWALAEDVQWGCSSSTPLKLYTFEKGQAPHGLSGDGLPEDVQTRVPVHLRQNPTPPPEFSTPAGTELEAAEELFG